jgi:hypothetical protein
VVIELREIENIKLRDRILIPRYLHDEIAIVTYLAFSFWAKSGDYIDIGITYRYGGNEVLDFRRDELKDIRVLKKPSIHKIPYTENKEIRIGDAVEFSEHRGYGETGKVIDMQYLIYEDIEREQYGIKVHWYNHRKVWYYFDTDDIMERFYVLFPS